MPRRRIVPILFLSAALTLSLASSTFAYLDPGTGSFIFQVVIAAVCGAGFAIKMFWARIKGFLHKLWRRSDNEDQ